MNFTELVDRTEGRFRDESNRIYTAAEYGKFVNEAYREAATDSALFPPWQAVTTVSLTSTGVVALPTDTLFVIAVYDTTNDRPLSQLHGQKFRHTFVNDEEGPPEYYRQRGTSIQVYPPGEAATLRVEYQGGFTELVSTGEPLFPEQFHDLIVEGALALACQDDGDTEGSDRHYAKFQKRLNDMKNALLPFAEGGEYVALVDDFWA